jgi:prepilin-type N-terminal cleavage/methylation domain-containing protein
MMPAERTKRNDEGFSLIEVMVAIVILTVGLLSLAQMMVVATNSNTLSGRMTSCSALAKEQLERLKSAPFYTNPQGLVRNPILMAGGDTNVNVNGYSQAYDANGAPTAGVGMYDVRWQIADVPSALPLAMVSIQVRCLANQGLDQFSFIGEARFITFRTANVG